MTIIERARAAYAAAEREREAYRREQEKRKKDLLARTLKAVLGIDAPSGTCITIDGITFILDPIYEHLKIVTTCPACGLGLHSNFICGWVDLGQALAFPPTCRACTGKEARQ